MNKVSRSATMPYRPLIGNCKSALRQLSRAAVMAERNDRRVFGKDQSAKVKRASHGFAGLQEFEAARLSAILPAIHASVSDSIHPTAGTERDRGWKGSLRDPNVDRGAREFGPLLHCWKLENDLSHVASIDVGELTLIVLCSEVGHGSLWGCGRSCRARDWDSQRAIASGWRSLPVHSPL
jgi:hypothetical protein